ncbi:MAG: OB-fold nucleic acid binding domain-containing protein, partial [Pseudomonadota bacterium]|nr:OB-fold nucleic acid binding domain-containing protein [Pseudomonadota bacterium]
MTIYSVAQVLAGAAAVGDTVTVRGWVRTRRDSKAGVSFIQLHDGSCFAALQIVAPMSLTNYQDEVLKVSSGCSVKATGKLVESLGKGQSFEVNADEIEVLGWIEDPETYPIQPKRHTMEFLRTVAHLRPRTNTFSALTRVRHCVA